MVDAAHAWEEGLAWMARRGDQEAIGTGLKPPARMMIGESVAMTH
jgi:hypothetical protein